MHTERTAFIIKPYIDSETAQEIIAVRNHLIWENGAEFRIACPFSYPNLNLNQWREFYKPIISRVPPEIYDSMCEDFASQKYALRGDIIEKTDNSTQSLIDLLREITGDFRNPALGTIRQIFGDYKKENKSWRTVVHASTREDVSRELEFLANLGIIPKELTV